MAASPWSIVLFRDAGVMALMWSFMMLNRATEEAQRVQTVPILTLRGAVHLRMTCINHSMYGRCSIAPQPYSPPAPLPHAERLLKDCVYACDSLIVKPEWGRLSWAAPRTQLPSLTEWLGCSLKPGVRYLSLWCSGGNFPSDSLVVKRWPHLRLMARLQLEAFEQRK